MSKNQFTGTATQPQCNRKVFQFNNDQYCNYVGVLALHETGPNMTSSMLYDITINNVTFWCPKLYLYIILPVPDPNCRDHEEDGISCAALDLFRLCSDSSVLSYVIAREKCPKHCGFCTPSKIWCRSSKNPNSDFRLKFHY